MTDIERQAEDIVRAMVSQSWNEEIETIAAMLRELEAARKVADAATGHAILMRCSRNLPYVCHSLLGPLIVKLMDEEAAAVREYRQFLEDTAPPSERVRAAIASGLEKVGEMEAEADATA